MGRYASPNELRTISREDLGWYNNVVLGAIYTFTHDDDDADKVLSAEHYYPALRRIVRKHPFLTVVVRDQHTDKAYYEHVASVDLSRHISILPGSGSDSNGSGKGKNSLGFSNHDHDNEVTRIEALLPALADYAHPAERPPWSVTVVPLSRESGKSSTTNTTKTTTTQRCFIAFAFSHVLGDGMNGLTFHEDLLTGLRTCSDSPTTTPESAILSIPATIALDEPFDTPQRLPISWGYLLGPLFAVCLPKWFAILFGIRASTSTLRPGTWIGPPMFDSNKRAPPSSSPTRTGSKTNNNMGTIIEKDVTQLRVIDIPATQLNCALQMARSHGAKLTGALHQIIVHALSDALPDRVLRPRRRSSSMGLGMAGNDKADVAGEKFEPAMAITNFASQTAINMRPTLNIPNTKMGLYVNGCFDYHPRRMVRDTKQAASTVDSMSETTTPDSTPMGPLTETEWAAASATTKKLSLCGATLQDQPIGLLRYAPSVRGWMAKKMGQRRDCSYEMSNLLAFTPPPPPPVASPAAEDGVMEEGGKHRVGIEWIVFAQPRNPTSAPIVFDVVSVRGGNLVISVVWQAGALSDVTVSLEDEEMLIEEICDGVKAEFAMFVE